MSDKAIGLFSILILGGFLGILIWFVPHADLVIIVLAVFSVAVYDYYHSTYGSGRHEN
jgi:hypothetical protein